jgi:hypothetical protein
LPFAVIASAEGARQSINFTQSHEGAKKVESFVPLRLGVKQESSEGGPSVLD